MQPSTRGFTLIEMLITVVVVAVLLAVAVPGFSGFITRYRVEGVANELRTDLQYARSESIRLRAPVRLVTAADGTGYSLLNASTSPGTVLKAVTLTSGVSVTADVTLQFDSLRGMATSVGFIEVMSSSISDKLKVTLDAAGKVSSCVSAGNFPGVSVTC